MNLGVIATANDSLDQETAILIVQEIGHKAVPMDERTVEDTLFDDEDNVNEKNKRPPVVTIKGQDDHGKTTLDEQFLNNVTNTHLTLPTILLV